MSAMITENAFSESEYRARIERLRTSMSNARLDCVLCAGPALICYFSGYDAHTHFTEQALVIGREGEPALVIRDVDVAPADPLHLEPEWQGPIDKLLGDELLLVEKQMGWS